MSLIVKYRYKKLLGDADMTENNLEKNAVTQETAPMNKRTDLTDKDFYEQACQYFYYHAEQRITMINYFIAVFGAGIALYGNFIDKNPTAAFIVSTFLLIISVLFCSIDFRNKFDVKQSQSVIVQIERDYGRDRLEGADSRSTYGVFSNEDNTFRYVGREHRNEEANKEYREIRKLYKKIKRLKKKKSNVDKVKMLEAELGEKIDAYLLNDSTISKEDFCTSIKEKSIRSLSNSIKYMYYLCVGASIGGMLWALSESKLIITLIAFIKNIFS